MAKLKSDGVISQKIVGLQINKFPVSSYVTVGGYTLDQMYTIDGKQPVYYYKSTESRRWKAKINDLLMLNADNKTFSRHDTNGAGVHYAEASIDSFYRSILIPQQIFPDFISMLDTQYNKSGPAAGLIQCNEKDSNGNCWVQGKTCSEVKSGFRDILLEFSDSRAYPISPDSYLLDSTGKDPKS